LRLRRGFFEEEKGFGIKRTLSVDSEISMTAPKYRGKFLGGIYLHSICKRKSRATQTPENLYEKPAERKNHGEKREIPLIRKITRSSQHSITDSIP